MTYVRYYNIFFSGHPRADADAAHVDQDSVCSCTCLGGSSITGHRRQDSFLNPAPPPADLIPAPGVDASDLLLLESACNIGAGSQGADFLIEPPEIFTYGFRRKRMSI